MAKQLPSELLLAPGIRISIRGGYDQLVSQRSNGEIHFEIYYKENNNSRPITYELTIAKDEFDRPYVKEERRAARPCRCVRLVRRSYLTMYLKGDYYDADEALRTFIAYIDEH